MNTFLKIILTKLLIYKKTVDYIMNNLFSKLFSKKKEKEYINIIAENKQKYCQHKNVSRLSKSKFYCSDCGKVLHFLSEEEIILLELAGIVLIGSIFFLLFSRRKE
jgi:uncharacterized paraquat-inducible protein A